MTNESCNEPCCREKVRESRNIYLYSLAVGTFESYLQDTWKWDNYKEFKELIEAHCPSGSDFEEMFSYFWGHREGEEEEEEEDVTVDDVASVLNLPIAKEEEEE